MFKEEGGGPFYRIQKRRKSHIKPMWDSYLLKTTRVHESKGTHGSSSFLLGVSRKHFQVIGEDAGVIERARRWKADSFLNTQTHN